MTETGFAPPIAARLANAAVVLVRPKAAENIGAAARVATNMGIGRLLVVSGEMPDMAKVRTLATHHARDLASRIELFPDLGQALAPFALAIAATARQGRRRQTIRTPRQVLAGLGPFLDENRLALVFGPEDHGLANEDLALCQKLVTIPTADYASLNLAQAVAILCYELASSLAEPAGPAAPALPKMADLGEIAGLYRHIDQVLATIGFLHGPDHDHQTAAIRRFVGRVGLKSREVRLLRGVCRQLLWLVGKKPGTDNRS